MPCGNTDVYKRQIPAIIGMTLTSLYNIIDSVFIGHGVGALAISGLAISFPLMNLLVAFFTLVGVGGATISSIRLGQKLSLIHIDLCPNGQNERLRLHTLL